MNTATDTETENRYLRERLERVRQLLDELSDHVQGRTRRTDREWMRLKGEESQLIRRLEERGAL
jgi:predicted  nucleic acid-binding Zn-ribbon protein